MGRQLSIIRSSFYAWRARADTVTATQARRDVLKPEFQRVFTFLRGLGAVGVGILIILPDQPSACQIRSHPSMQEAPIHSFIQPEHYDPTARIQPVIEQPNRPALYDRAFSTEEGISIQQGWKDSNHSYTLDPDGAIDRNVCLPGDWSVAIEPEDDGSPSF